MRFRSLLLACLCNVAVATGGCASEEPEDGTGGGRQDPDDPPVEVAFTSPLCQEGLCWVAPAPQGNLLRDAHTSLAGTTFAVGDNGVILRWSGARFEATTAVDGRPALHSVYALADDDVWVVGEAGTVLHLGPDGLVSRRPDESAESDAFVAVRSFEGDGGWLVSRAGGVFRLQDGTWQRSFSATANNQIVTLLGLWAPSADEAWVLGRLGDAAHLYRFDGSAWSELPVTIDDPIDLVPAGAPVAITGSTPGAAQIAFSYRVVEVTADGAQTTLHEEPIGSSFGPSAIADLRADATGETWAAFESGTVTALKVPAAASFATTARALGEGPDGRILLLRSAGGIGDPLAPSAPRRAIDPLVVPLGYGAQRCAPAGADAVCLLDSASGSSQIWRFAGADGSPALIDDAGTAFEARLFANATGLVALAESGVLRIFDQSGERTIDAPSGTIEDVAVSDDGTVYMVELDGSFWKVAPASSALSPIAFSGGPSQSDQTLPELHRAGPNTIYFTAVKYVNQDQNINLVVRSADGALVHDVFVPHFSSFPVRAVTASGVPYIVTLTDAGYTAMRLDGSSWTELDAPAGASSALTAFGDRVLLRTPDEDGTIHLFDAAGVRPVTLPAHGLVHVVPSDAGIFGVTEHQESALPGFSGYGGVATFFAAAD